MTWGGWVEAFTFPSGADRLRVNIEPDGSGGWTGFLLAGEGPHIDGIPRSAADCAFLCSGPIHEHLIHIEPPIEGFRYALKNVTHTDLRLRFEIDRNEIFAAWCEAQTPVLDESNTEEERFRCVRSAGGMYSPPYACFLTPDGEDPIRIPCCQVLLCGLGGVCDCTATECVATQNLLVFDLFIEGDAASGTTPFGTGHLQRVSP